MTQIRISLSCLLASAVCFVAGCAQIRGTGADGGAADGALYGIPTERTAAETETILYDIPLTDEECAAITEAIAVDCGTLYQPMSARSLDNTPLTLPEEEPQKPGTPEPETAEQAPAGQDTAVEVEDNSTVSSAEPQTLDGGGAKAQEEYLRRRAFEEKEAELEAAAAQRKAEERRHAAAEARERALSKARAAEEAKRAACPGYNAEYVATLTKEEQAEAEAFYEEGYVFFRQNWSITKELPYGDEGFGQCGCGPTVTAALIANLAGKPVTPEDMRKYAIETGAYIPNVGTTYNFIMTTTAAYGIKATNVVSKEAVVNALKAGKLVLATMGPGDFTLGAHFMLYRGITDDGKILIADSYSYELSAKEWDWDTLEGQLKNGYWVFEME